MCGEVNRDDLRSEESVRNVVSIRLRSGATEQDDHHQ